MLTAYYLLITCLKTLKWVLHLLANAGGANMETNVATETDEET